MVTEDRKRILKMLAEKKISAAEAEELLDALYGNTPSQHAPANPTPRKNIRFLLIQVSGPDTVDIRIPIGLLRAGMKLATLIPKQAIDHVNQAMRDHGMRLDLSSLKPEDIEEFIRNLGEMEINVNSKDGHHIRIQCSE